MTTFSPEFDREIELLLEQTRLFRFVSAVVNARLRSLLPSRFASALANTCASWFLATSTLGKSMIIQTGFADRDDARTFRQLAQRL